MLNIIDTLLTILLIAGGLAVCALFALIMYAVGGPITGAIVVVAMAATLYVIYS